MLILNKSETSHQQNKLLMSLNNKYLCHFFNSHIEYEKNK